MQARRSSLALRSRRAGLDGLAVALAARAVAQAAAAAGDPEVARVLREIAAYIIVNNKAEGSAPLTIHKLADRLVQRS